MILIEIVIFQFTRGPGIAVIVLPWIITLYTLWQMVEMHEIVPGKRFDRYHELGQHAFGEKLGLWVVVPQQLIVEVGVNIVYMITGGTSLKKFHDTVCNRFSTNLHCKPMKTTYFIIIFSGVHFIFISSSQFQFHDNHLCSCSCHVLEVSNINQVLTFLYFFYSIIKSICINKMSPLIQLIFGLTQKKKKN